jgi:hypothetical protein
MRCLQESVSSRLKLLVLFFAAIGLLAGCGPSVKNYVVDVKYLYTGLPDEQDIQERYTITIARFRDARKIADRRTVGAVTAPWWDDSVPIVPRDKAPADIVMDAVRAQLSKGGFSVSGPAPAWNLEGSTLKKDWGRYVLGGVIEELHLEGKNDPPVCYYDTSVRLVFVMGDTETGEIVRHTAERESMWTQATMNRESMERQINSIFSRVIAEGLEPERVRKMIRNLAPDPPRR